MKKILIQTTSIAFSLLTMMACDFRKSVNKDLISGLLTTGNGLSCESVFLSIGEETIQRSSYAYGEEISINFNHMEGFKLIENHAFPGLELIVTSQNGDTLLWKPDLYEDLKDGTDHSPLLLISDISIARPIYSGGSYTALVRIWDKKSDGVFRARLDFKVKPNEQIAIESNQITFSEIYLFSSQKQWIIIQPEVDINEHVLMIFEGLEGFVNEKDSAYIGMELRLRDAENRQLLFEEDLIRGPAMEYSEIHSLLAANFVLTGSQISNPVTCEVFIWDKKGPASIKASAQIQILY